MTHIADQTTVEARTGAAETLFAGGGEMESLCRDKDWSATPLGPVEGWSVALRTAVGIVLGSRNPMFLFWGPEHVQIYNDAYRPSLGASTPDGASRHPRALGMRGHEFWTEIWDAIGPQMEQVMATGEATWHEDQYLPIERNGGIDDAWWTYSYSAVRDDDGSIQGVLVVCMETTHRVLHTRDRERLLADTARAERRAERILERMGDRHLATDADFRIVAVNAAVERALGVPRASLVGLPLCEALPTLAGTEAEDACRRVLAEGAERHFIARFHDDRILEVDAYPTDEGGVALFWRDVSERRAAEEALRESEARYRLLFDSLDEGFCVIEVIFDDAGAPVDYRFLEANPAFGEQTGMSDVIGRRMRELAPGHEAHWFETYGRVARTGEPIRFEAGAEALGRWYDVYAFRLGAPNEHRVAVLFRDVSAARAAARERERLMVELEVERSRLAEVFRRAPSFLGVLRGAEYRYEFVNDAYMQLVGHDRSLLGRPLLEGLPELRGQGFMETLDHVVATGEAWVGETTPTLLQRTPGARLETRYLDMVFQALSEADGTRSGVAVHGFDVTEQVLARREVERLLRESEGARAEAEDARAEAEAANRAKSEFLAVMSHELRTPLNAIGGYTELVQMGIHGPVTDDQLQALGRIQQSQRHLLGLINEVLNYAKLETGTVHFDVEDVPLPETLAAAELLVAPQAHAKGLSLVVGECVPPLQARADAEKLRQILVNLLSNAVKFTDRGGRVSVECDAEGPRVRVHVRDTGIGIPADKLEAIFDPFVQVRSDLKRPHEGTGLGLAISRELARAMGGDLTARSTEGVGSEFTVTLPISSI